MIVQSASALINIDSGKQSFRNIAVIAGHGNSAEDFIKNSYLMADNKGNKRCIWTGYCTEYFRIFTLID